jgi:phosphonopyruvate decarboxylase
MPTVDPAKFCEVIKNNGISFFTGVPDSLLRDFTAYVTSTYSSESHVIAANEGNAVALASGYYLATGRPALVYMQNSGIGNAVNPLQSLADELVYSIPMLLVIGWRGEPGKKKDEPQHAKQGQTTLALLEAMDISYELLNSDLEDFQPKVDNIISKMKSTSSPVALVISAGTFSKYDLNVDDSDSKSFPMSREDAITSIIASISDDDLIVSTTGMASRELFECRERLGQGHSSDFLTVGSMGHCSQIALGIAMQTPDRRVICIDGDGAVLMHLGSLAIAGTTGPSNLTHLIINNGSHDSVGGQPTVAREIDFPAIANACGYAKSDAVSTLAELDKALANSKDSNGPTLVEINVRSGARADLGRPTISPVENKNAFMGNIRNGR